MSNLKKRSLEDDIADTDCSKMVKTDIKLHNFKKKKLKHMHDDSKKNIFLSKLEDLLSQRKEWQNDHIESLFSIMHDHFEVVNIYGFQIENAILCFIDIANSDKAIQLAALCFSRFASIKKSNGTILIQNILSTFLKFGKDYFDFFNIPSNLNEIKYTFKESLLSFSELKISDETILQLIKRLKFLIYTVNFVFETNYDMNLFVPFENLIKTIIGFLCTTPKELIDYSKKNGVNKEIPFYINIHVWKLFQKVLIIPEFKGLFFDIIPKICEIIRLCLSEDLIDNPLQQLYISNILNFLICLLSNEARYCLSTVTCLIEIIIRNVLRIITNAFSNSYENVITLYLQIINKLVSFHHDKSIQKCINTFAYQFNEIKSYLLFLESKSIYSTLEFLNEFTLFMKLINKFVVNDFRIECTSNSIKFEEKINLEKKILNNENDNSNNINKNQLNLLENENLVKNDDIIEESVENDLCDIDRAVENIQKTISSISDIEENSINNQDKNDEAIVEECNKSDTIENRSGEIISENNEIKPDEQKINSNDSEQLQFEDKIVNLEEMLLSFVPY